MEQRNINNASMLRVGTILRGVFRIDSYLASGGFGKTYIATNIEFNERVAIKEFFIKDIAQRDSNTSVISVTNGENLELFAEQKEKFKKEARRMRQLNNPHIVRVHDLFEENGTAYYVMDYIDGENLSRRLERTGRPMSESEVRSILPQILDALKTVHDANIWHLDLKPSNIMLDKSGNVKLIDFGASKQLNTQKGGATTGTRISYTPGYAPREQMEQNYDKFGPWTDIYALGATVYNLLTNKRPPLPSDIDDDISEGKHFALPLPSAISAEVQHLVIRTMTTDYKKRPQSIKDVRSYLMMGSQTVSSEIPPVPIPKIVPPVPNLDSVPPTNIAAQTTMLYPPTLQENHNARIATKTIINEEGKTINSSSSNNLLINSLRKPTESKKSSDSFGIIIGVIMLIFILSLSIGLIILNSTNDNNSQSELNEGIKDSFTFDSKLGECHYYGTIDENNRPHGNGTAEFKDGRYYSGPFNHGIFEGKDAFFKYENGDTFRGEFRNNSFYYGTYTIGADGSYFTGSYKNGKPDGGKWYNKNGKVIENI